jgi:hypothetical protein
MGRIIKIKGTSVIDALEAVRKREGEQRLGEIIGSLDAASRDVFRRGLLPTNYYSLDAFVAFLEAGLRLSGDDERILIQRSGAVAERQLTGLYRVFVKLGSPEFVVRRISVIHQTYFVGTAVQVHALQPGEARIRYLGFGKQHRLMEYVMIGFYQKALEICGARNIQAQMSVPMATDGAYCELCVTWQ